MTQPLPPRGQKDQILGERLLSSPVLGFVLVLAVVPLGLAAVGHALGLDDPARQEQHLMRYFVLGGTASVLASGAALVLAIRYALRR